MSSTSIPFKFDPLTVKRRAALGYLPNVKDPELQLQMKFSQLKSSRSFVFKNNDYEVMHDSNSIGYSMVRTTRALSKPGKYYWEIVYNGSESNQGHCRIGISTINAPIEGPVGFTEDGYALRDAGDAFHKAIKYPGPSFNVNDTVGFGLEITEKDCKFYCWINGANQTLLFDNIPIKTYYPSVSTYRDAVVSGRFEKQSFKFYPDDSWTPANDHPFIESKSRYEADELLNIMSSGDIKLLNEELVSIINQALAPPEDIPA
ncbi:SPRY domain containing protein [Trichomonas vaginalis G3]|uniref:SPRY domain containing protein n=1 Tax=Trichomonas vaginalis (strain ATCC PRA-98 / G3) TaxID=412133 RepID=A2DEG6_TRIV3|nr:euchromatin binding [Trichomonas vaginalis G3]EAY21093.1 SPRY domain containing protein [Trichomonas vaginalis G3]KAI5539979.1 euchromatin binding [Trichomonas vaginalis G3]|eukprot:XP_001582079.1 SPRY domain containing protein [Trichomonas vaginalis G3]